MIKRIIHIFSASCILIAVLTICSITSAANSIEGDVNGDGLVNSADARLILKYSIGNCELDDTQIKVADVSKNKMVNFKDVDYLWARMKHKTVKSNADSNKTETTTSTTTTTTTTTTTNPSMTSTSETGPTTSRKLAPIISRTSTTTTTTTTAGLTGRTTTKTTTKNSTTKKTTAAPTTTTTTKATATAGAKPQGIPTLTAVKTPKYTPSLKTASTAESTYMSKIKVKNTSTGKVYTGKTKEELQLAVTAAVKYELGNSRSASSSTEAWKAQAILCYTDMCATCVNGGTFSISLRQDVDLSISNDKKIYDAVGTVLGQKLMTSGTKLASVFYFAYASNSTSTCGKYYVEDIPYLQAVYSPETVALVKKYYGSDSFISTKETTMTSLLEKLSNKVGSEVHVESKKGYFSLYATEWDGSYVYKTNLYYNRSGSKVYITGRQVRDVLGLKSSSFTVTKQTDDTITLSVRGYGHGVGMSQIGAVIYANEYGWNYKQILAHYFSISSSSSCQIYKAKW